MLEHAPGQICRVVLWAALLSPFWAQSAEAQQVVLVDQTITARRGLPATELNKSEYYFSAAGFANPSPASLRSPVNYAEGNIYMRVEVLSKPSTVPTLMSACLDNGTALTCARYLPQYTGPTVLEYDEPMLGQYNYMVYDFAKPVTRIVLGIKDASENIIDSSDPAYDSFFPTEMRVTLALVAKGATYVPGMMPPRDAGTPVQDAGGPSAQDAGTPAGADAGPGPGGSSGGATPVIVDSRVTATAQSATESKVSFALLPGAPTNLRTPVNYSAGKIHARLEVFSKPSGAPTSVKACLESTSNKTVCTRHLGGQTYLSLGAIDDEQALTSLENAASYDWTSPLRRAYLVVGDALGASVQGNAEFFPTDLRMTLTLLPPGTTYTPPWEIDAGGKAGGPDASDAGTGSGSGPSVVIRDDAGTIIGVVLRDGSAPVDDDSPARDGGRLDPFGDPPLDSLGVDGSDGCSLVASTRIQAGQLASFALVLLLGRALRRRRDPYENK